jgi:hypothetical protein
MGLFHERGTKMSKYLATSALIATLAAASLA